MGAPKVAIIGRSAQASKSASGGSLSVRYFVNPERAEMHPTVAMTASQAIGAACLVEGSVARSLLAATPSINPDDSSSFTFIIEHVAGTMEVTIGTAADTGDAGLPVSMFPQGVPNAGKYSTTVHPIAEGRALL